MDSQQSQQWRAAAAASGGGGRRRSASSSGLMQQLAPHVPPVLQPLFQLAQPHADELLAAGAAALDAASQHAYVRRGVDVATAHLQPLAQRTDAALSGLPPWQVALLAAAVTLLVLLLLQALGRRVSRIRRVGLLQWACACLRSAPGVRSLLAVETDKIRAKIAGTIKRDGLSITRLPAQGRPAKAVMELLRAKEARNIRISPGTSSMSGVVYITDDTHKQLLDEAYTLFSWTNPLHADVFPSVRQMEAEVVAMTAALLNGGPGTSTPDACGAMTSGGTESILLAVKAARDYASERRGITEPEMVVGPSAHAAYWKAAEYFGIRLVQARLGRDLRLHGAAVARCIGPNTVLVVASAPGFPHGVVDDVEGIAAAAARRGVLCHVDACLGGFLLPFVEQLGYEVPAWDFRVPGVTSVSVDTHKFGMAHKGTSVVLYRRPDIRRHQFTQVTDWTGGLYISPSMAGSRSGALIATAWASLLHLGSDGLLAAAQHIMDAATEFRRQLARRVPELRVLGQPHMSVVAFAAVRPRRLNIYVLNDLLTQRGWHLNALQRPAALHFCFTAQHASVVPALVADLRACIDALAAQGPSAAGKDGSAPLYGLAGISPDRGLVGHFLTAFQEEMLAP